MRRAMKHILIFGLLASGGMVASFVAAWICALMLPMPWSQRMENAGRPSNWEGELVWLGLGAGRICTQRSRTLTERVDSTDWREVFDPNRREPLPDMIEGIGRNHTVMLCGYGWPSISHVAVREHIVIFDRAEEGFMNSPPTAQPGTAIRDGVRFNGWDGWWPPSWGPASWHEFGWDTLVPIRPLWLGFMINTVFYGVGFWLLWFGLFRGPGMIRRGVRRRRGRCVKCGYDLRGNAAGSACPECGVAG